MGYYVSLDSSNAVLPASQLDEALRRFKALNEPENDHLKSGGRYSGGKQTAKWFAWMPESFDHYETAKEVLDDLGFEVEERENGDLWIGGYDSKIGSEEHFIRAIADLLPADTYMVWRGEDGEMWRWIFDGKTMTTQEGKVVFV